MKQIDDDIIRDYDYFYGNYDEDSDGHYDDGEPYSKHISRELYNGEDTENGNFEAYKNMFESENLLTSKEQIDETIDGLNDWFENSEFGEDLSLSNKEENNHYDQDEERQLPKFPHFPVVPEKSEFERRNKNNRRNFNRNIRGSYKNQETSDGRSFGNFKEMIVDESKTRKIKIPSNKKLDRMVGNVNADEMQETESNIVPMKMNNNNLNVKTHIYSFIQLLI